MNINATIIGQSIAFFIFVLFCMKYVWPPIINALRVRQEKIAEGLNAASRANEELEAAKSQVNEQLSHAKVEAAALVDQAKKRANLMVEEAKTQAKVEADRIKQQALADLETEVNQVKDRLRSQLGTLVVAGAERILNAQVDAQSHAKLVDELAAQL